MGFCKQYEREQIAAGVIAGDSQNTIAEKIGMSEATVSRAINKNAEVNALIAAGFKELSGAWTKAVKNVKQVVEDYDKPIPDQYTKFDLLKKEHGFKASERLIESMGLLPSHSQPVYIQNILNVSNNQFISPIVSRAIDRAMSEVVLERPKYELLEDNEDNK